MAPASAFIFTLAVLSACGSALGEQLQFQRSSQTEKASGSNTICPDGGHCPTAYTCCPSGRTYTCCRYNSGTCCAGGRTCCQHGCRCDALGRHCICSDLFSQLVKSVKSKDKKQPSSPPQKELVKANTICPDGGSCPSKQTCCPQGSHYACCPYPSGTCCADQQHCCPLGYRCGSGAGRCQLGKKTAAPFFLL